MNGKSSFMKHLQIIFFILLPFTLIGQNNLYKITYSNVADIDVQVRGTDVLYLNEKMAYYEVGKKRLLIKTRHFPKAMELCTFLLLKRKKSQVLFIRILKVESSIIL